MMKLFLLSAVAQKGMCMCCLLKASIIKHCHALILILCTVANLGSRPTRPLTYAPALVQFLMDLRVFRFYYIPIQLHDRCASVFSLSLREKFREWQLWQQFPPLADCKYSMGVPWDTTDPSKKECLVPPPELECRSAPWSRWVKNFDARFQVLLENCVNCQLYVQAIFIGIICYFLFQFSYPASCWVRV